jgi:hypothetical protein
MHGNHILALCLLNAAHGYSAPSPRFVAIASLPARHAIYTHRFKFRQIEAEMLHNERSQSFAVGQLDGFGRAASEDVDVLIHDVDAAFFRWGAGEDVVGEEGAGVGGGVVVHHLEIDRVFHFHRRNPASDLLTLAGDVEEPIITFAGESMGGSTRRDRRAVHRDWKRAGEGAKARIDYIGTAADCDSEKHMLARTLVTRVKKEDPGCVPHRVKADCLESGMHEARVFEAIAATTGSDDLGLQAFGVETNWPTEKDVEAFEWDGRGMVKQYAGQGIIGRSARAGIVDPCEVSIEV